MDGMITRQPGMIEKQARLQGPENCSDCLNYLIKTPSRYKGLLSNTTKMDYLVRSGSLAESVAAFTSYTGCAVRRTYSLEASSAGGAPCISISKTSFPPF